MKRLFVVLLALAMVFALAACGGGKEQPKGSSGTADPTPSTSGAEEPNNDSEDESPQDPAGPADLSWWSSAEHFKEFLPYSGNGSIAGGYEDGPKDRFGEDVWTFALTDVTREDFDAYVDQLLEDGAILWKSRGNAEEDELVIGMSRESGNIAFQTGSTKSDSMLTIAFGQDIGGAERLTFTAQAYYS